MELKHRRRLRQQNRTLVSAIQFAIIPALSHCTEWAKNAIAGWTRPVLKRRYWRKAVLLRTRVAVETLNFEFSCPCLQFADYIKEMYQSLCCTCSMDFFPRSTNRVIDFCSGALLQSSSRKRPIRRKEGLKFAYLIMKNSTILISQPFSPNVLHNIRRTWQSDCIVLSFTKQLMSGLSWPDSSTARALRLHCSGSAFESRSDLSQATAEVALLSARIICI